MLTVKQSQKPQSESCCHRAIVLGAASGMGSAIATRLTDRGHRVAGFDLETAEWPDGLDIELKSAVDVTDAASVESAFGQSTEALGGVDIVVNCAGILGPVAPISETDQATFERVIATNLGGAFSITKAAVQRLLPQDYGRIVHIASIAGKEGNPQMSAYSASKAGVIGMVKSVAKETAASGVTINAIAPASIDTPLITGMTEERREVQRNLIPMGRFGTVDEIAALVEFVVSPEASFTTGFVFDASGGRSTY